MNFEIKKYLKLLIFFCASVIIIYFVYITINWDFIEKQGDVKNTLFFLSIVLSPVLAITLHELGHLFAGLFQGFKLDLFVVGFLGIKRIDNKIKFYFNKDIQLFGGVAATSPRSILSDRELIEKFKIVIISGPFSSLLTSILAFSLLLFTDTLLNPFWEFLGITSLLIFGATTIPTKSGIFFTDRARYQRLSNKGKDAEIELVLLQIMNHSVVYKNFKDIDIQKTCKLKADKDQSIQFWGHYFEFQYYKDNQNAEKMNELKNELKNFKAIIPSSIWKSLEID